MAEKGVVGKVHPTDELTANEAAEARWPTVGEIVLQFFVHLWAIRSTVIMVVAPFALLPIPIVYGSTPVSQHILMFDTLESDYYIDYYSWWFCFIGRFDGLKYSLLQYSMCGKTREGQQCIFDYF